MMTVVSTHAKGNSLR